MPCSGGSGCEGNRAFGVGQTILQLNIVADLESAEGVATREEEVWGAANGMEEMRIQCLIARLVDYHIQLNTKLGIQDWFAWSTACSEWFA